MIAQPRSIRHRILLTVILAVGLVAGFLALRQRVLVAQDQYIYRAASSDLILKSSGRLWNTDFRRPPKSYGNLYHYNGSESPSRRFVRWSKGRLKIGVNQSGIPAFKGFFAVTEPTFPAGSYIETSMKPIRVSPQLGQVAETIVAVQTATTAENGQINYVIASVTQSHSSKTLQLGYAHGLIAHAKTVILRNFRTPHLMSDVSNNPVTITTNGVHDLKIWLGNALLLNKSQLPLKIIPPFQIYLEVQSDGLTYAAQFHSLRVYRSNGILIKGLPQGATLEARGSHGTLLAYGVSHHGIYTIDLNPPRLERMATLIIKQEGHTTTFHHVSLVGGDVFAYQQSQSSWAGQL